MEFNKQVLESLENKISPESKESEESIKTYSEFNLFSNSTSNDDVNDENLSPVSELKNMAKNTPTSKFSSNFSPVINSLSKKLGNLKIGTPAHSEKNEGRFNVNLWTSPFHVNDSSSSDLTWSNHIHDGVNIENDLHVTSPLDIVNISGIEKISESEINVECKFNKSSNILHGFYDNNSEYVFSTKSELLNTGASESVIENTFKSRSDKELYFSAQDKQNTLRMHHELESNPKLTRKENLVVDILEEYKTEDGFNKNNDFINKDVHHTLSDQNKFSKTDKMNNQIQFMNTKDCTDEHSSEIGIRTDEIASQTFINNLSNKINDHILSEICDIRNELILEQNTIIDGRVTSSNDIKCSDHIVTEDEIDITDKVATNIAHDKIINDTLSQNIRIDDVNYANKLDSDLDTVTNDHDTKDFPGELITKCEKSADHIANEKFVNKSSNQLNYHIFEGICDNGNALIMEADAILNGQTTLSNDVNCYDHIAENRIGITAEDAINVTHNEITNDTLNRMVDISENIYINVKVENKLDSVTNDHIQFNDTKELIAESKESTDQIENEKFIRSSHIAENRIGITAEDAINVTHNEITNDTLNRVVDISENIYINVKVENKLDSVTNDHIQFNDTKELIAESEESTDQIENEKFIRSSSNEVNDYVLPEVCDNRNELILEPNVMIDGRALCSNDINCTDHVVSENRIDITDKNSVHITHEKVINDSQNSVIEMLENVCVNTEVNNEFTLESDTILNDDIQFTNSINSTKELSETDVITDEIASEMFHNNISNEVSNNTFLGVYNNKNELIMEPNKMINKQPLSSNHINCCDHIENEICITVEDAINVITHDEITNDTPNRVVDISQSIYNVKDENKLDSEFDSVINDQIQFNNIEELIAESEESTDQVDNEQFVRSSLNEVNDYVLSEICDNKNELILEPNIIIDGQALYSNDTNCSDHVNENGIDVINGGAMHITHDEVNDSQNSVVEMLQITENVMGTTDTVTVNITHGEIINDTLNKVVDISESMYIDINNKNKLDSEFVVNEILTSIIDKVLANKPEKSINDAQNYVANMSKNVCSNTEFTSELILKSYPIQVTNPMDSIKKLVNGVYDRLVSNTSNEINNHIMSEIYNNENGLILEQSVMINEQTSSSNDVNCCDHIIENSISLTDKDSINITQEEIINDRLNKVVNMSQNMFVNAEVENEFLMDDQIQCISVNHLSRGFVDKGELNASEIASIKLDNVTAEGNDHVAKENINVIEDLNGSLKTAFLSSKNPDYDINEQNICSGSMKQLGFEENKDHFTGDTSEDNLIDFKRGTPMAYTIMDITPARIGNLMHDNHPCHTPNLLDISINKLNACDNFICKSQTTPCLPKLTRIHKGEKLLDISTFSQDTPARSCNEDNFTKKLDPDINNKLKLPNEFRGTVEVNMFHTESSNSLLKKFIHTYNELKAEHEVEKQMLLEQIKSSKEIEMEMQQNYNKVQEGLMNNMEENAMLEVENKNLKEYVAKLELMIEDIHEKYEKGKEVNVALKKNELGMVKVIEDYKILVNNLEMKYKALKGYANNELAKANAEIDSIIDLSKQKEIKYKATIGELNSEVQSLREAVQKLVIENTSMKDFANKFLTKR